MINDFRTHEISTTDIQVSIYNFSYCESYKEVFQVLQSFQIINLLSPHPICFWRKQNQNKEAVTKTAWSVRSTAPPAICSEI
jgi:hypothetical protein